MGEQSSGTQNGQGKAPIVVTGATGYTGREVVRQLCDRGQSVIAHIRPGSATGESLAPRFEGWGAAVDKTVWEEEAWVASLKQMQPKLIYFLIGTTKARMRQSDDDASYDAIDFGLFDLLLRACQKAAVAPKVVYLSALGVKPNARTAYYRARYKAEQALLNSGLDYVIARPAMITGANRQESRPLERVGGWMADAAAAGLKAMGAQQKAARWRSTDNEELAWALVKYGLDESQRAALVEAEDLKRGGPER